MRPFSEVLKELQGGISTDELARRSGISAPMISKMRQGTRASPGREVLWKLANALKVPISKLF